MCVIMDMKIISTTKEEDDEGLRNGWDEPYKDWLMQDKSTPRLIVK